MVLLPGTLWAQSVITEVYGLHALCCTALLWAMVRWHGSGEPRWLFTACFIKENSRFICYLAVFAFCPGFFSNGIFQRLLRQQVVCLSS